MITDQTCELHLHEGVEAQTFYAAQEGWLEDGAFILARYVLPAFRAPIENLDGRSVEVERGFRAVSQPVLYKCPKDPAPWRFQLVCIMTQFDTLPHCNSKSGSDRVPAFSFQSLRNLLYDPSSAVV